MIIHCKYYRFQKKLNNNGSKKHKTRVKYSDDSDDNHSNIDDKEIPSLSPSSSSSSPTPAMTM